jgi:hypothetical protein
VAVQMLLEVPSGNDVPDAGEQLRVTTPQLSVALGNANAAVPTHTPALVSTAAMDTHVAVGG